MYAENNVTSWNYTSPMDAAQIGEYTGTQSNVLAVDAVQRSFTQTGAPTVPVFAASIAALLAAINTNPATPKAVYVPIGRTPGRKNYRLSLGMHGEGSDGNGVLEDDYLVYAASLGGTPGVKTEKVGVATWTLGNLVATLVGARANAREAKAVGWAATGLLEKRVGVEAKANSVEPASLEINDAGEAIGILRCVYLPGSAAATAGHPYEMKWT